VFGPTRIVASVPAGIVTTMLRAVVDRTTATVAEASKICSRAAALPPFHEAIATRPARTSPSVARLPSRNTRVDCATGIQIVVPPASSWTTTVFAAPDCTIPRALPDFPCGGPLPSGFAFAGGGAASPAAGNASAAVSATQPRAGNDLKVRHGPFIRHGSCHGA